MRKLAVAVFGGVALAVASTAAYAIENSFWFGAGTVDVRLKTRGEPAFLAEGAFTGSGLGVFTDDVSLLVTPFELASPNIVTQTANIPVQVDVRRLTTRRATVDNEGGSTPIVLQNVIGDLVELSTVTAVAFTNKPPRGEDPIIPDPNAGFVFYTDTIDVRGGFTAIKNFTEVTGKLTIVVQGIEIGGLVDGRPCKGTIVIRYDGVRD